MEKVAGTVTNELAPASMREARMKKRIMELYMELGKTPDQARYQMHIDVQEWDGLMDHMNQPHIVQQFIHAQERRLDEQSIE